MLLTRLQEIIPKPYSEFSKLTDHGAPYLFAQWHLDINANDCLYFEFPSRDGQRMNRKRVVIKELEGLLRNRLEVNDLFFNHTIFAQFCPISQMQGTCGYAVTIRMFEYLKIAEYVGAQGCQLINPDLISEILD